MKLFLTIVLVVFSISNSLSDTNYTSLLDVQYREHSEANKNTYIAERCLLDIYYPVNSKDYATVVWFHGGGLEGGEKFIHDELKGQGLAVVAANYRLSPKVEARVCIEDAAASVAWVLKNIESLNGNANKVFLSGHSAGGYLASMVGLDKRYLAAHDLNANQLAGLIPFSGHTITHFTVRKERGISGKQPIVDEFAPLYHVRADAPPLLLITGDRELEMLGRYEENAYMMRMMRVNGHQDTRIMELDGYGHGMVQPAMPLLLNEIRRVLSLQEKSK